MLTDDEMRERMEKGWRGGLSDGTVCGVGSTMESTLIVREWLPMLCVRCYFLTLNDAGAGDRHWISTIDWHGTHVRSFDLIPRGPDVVALDITRETMPRADVILCRAVLNHLDQTRVGMALERFRESAPYLIATQYDRQEIDHREFTRLDLRSWLGDPIEQIDDGCSANCKLALWRIN